jgi:hypothetical protein
LAFYRAYYYHWLLACHKEAVFSLGIKNRGNSTSVPQIPGIRSQNIYILYILWSYVQFGPTIPVLYTYACTAIFSRIWVGHIHTVLASNDPHFGRNAHLDLTGEPTPHHRFKGTKPGVQEPGDQGRIRVYGTGTAGTGTARYGRR